jgi:hypothetical protein
MFKLFHARSCNIQQNSWKTRCLKGSEISDYLRCHLTWISHKFFTAGRIALGSGAQRTVRVLRNRTLSLHCLATLAMKAVCSPGCRQVKLEFSIVN